MAKILKIKVFKFLTFEVNIDYLKKSKKRFLFGL